MVRPSFALVIALTRGGGLCPHLYVVDSIPKAAQAVKGYFEKSAWRSLGYQDTQNFNDEAGYDHKGIDIEQEKDNHEGGNVALNEVAYGD